MKFSKKVAFCHGIQSKLFPPPCSPQLSKQAPALNTKLIAHRDCMWLPQLCKVKFLSQWPRQTDPVLKSLNSIRTFEVHIFYVKGSTRQLFSVGPSSELPSGIDSAQRRKKSLSCPVNFIRPAGKSLDLVLPGNLPHCDLVSTQRGCHPLHHLCVS